MESSIVIKVKHGETQDDPNARVADDKLLDGDVVTLVDDEELQDITRQDLNPLRISITSVGLAVDHELDVAVDFTAPQLPGGKYISWLEDGLAFRFVPGQRVWVLIQVDFSMTSPKKEFFYEASEDLT
ncbi:hypothetical protein HAX54_029533 [Datura stramonium]|uniref:Uncharacterized protein n=1 Tax=Datura stramonium TaxID=4076 RepID=A0ABS8V9G9_DATST|nr:hypothetical protein [Datura stramonium]